MLFWVSGFEVNHAKTNTKRKHEKIDNVNEMFFDNTEQNVLIFSSFSFFGTCLFCLYQTRHRVLTRMEEFLYVSILIQTILSVAFWTNPFPPYSLIHIMDGIFVKINVISFSSYILFVKSLYLQYRLSAFLFFIITIYCFYQSDKHSREIWCCKEHLYWHAWSHLFTAIGISHAFV
jgi:hypothetical protein